jgi:hypothetical protein
MGHIKVEQWTREEEAINSVQEASMPGDEGAGVLNGQGPFQKGFREVSELTSDPQEDSQGQGVEGLQSREKPPPGEKGSAYAGKEAGEAAHH